MALLTRVKSLMEVPLKDFPQAKGRYNDLYDIRSTAVLSDGYFLVKCDPGDHFESAFPLMGSNSGSHMLGQIVPSVSKVFPDREYYDVYIHGGSTDVSCFCTSPAELAQVMRSLDERGMEYVFVENEVWGDLDDSVRPFDELFVEFPSDVRFAMMFGTGGTDRDVRSLIEPTGDDDLDAAIREQVRGFYE